MGVQRIPGMEEMMMNAGRRIAKPVPPMQPSMCLPRILRKLSCVEKKNTSRTGGISVDGMMISTEAGIMGMVGVAAR